MATSCDSETHGTSSSLGSRPVINIRNFLDQWKADYADISFQMKNENEYFANKIGISMELTEELADVCKLDTLMCGHEPKDKADLLKMKGLPKDIDLTCVKYQERELERRKMVDYKIFAMTKMKYKVMDVQLVPNPDDMNKNIAEKDRIPRPNVVLTVRLYRTRMGTSIIPKGEVYQVLGTQCLTELRDSISCLKDDAIAGEFSSYPNIPNDSLTPAKKIYKSGMFFIENTFYNDMRESDSKDYSAPILKWAREKKHENYELFTTAKMEDTKFLDLNVQLGVPYLYQHQGSCEHILIFTDVRLLHNDDPQDINMYPFLISEIVNKRTICKACLMDSAKWIVHDSQLTPESPCFMCNNCFLLLHYDNEGHKVCSFRAFKYRQKISPP